MNAMSEATASTQPRRWLRFRLRSLLVVVAIIAGPMAWTANERQRSADELLLAANSCRPNSVRLGGVFDSWQLDRAYKPQGWWRRLSRYVLGDRVIQLDVTVEDYSPLARLSNIQVLYLQHSAARDLSPLAGLKEIRWLFLSRTPTRDLSPLRELKNLEQLQFSFTEVSDLSVIAEFKNLKQLKFEATGVSDLTPVSGLKHLTVIDLRSTSVRDVAPLLVLKQLKVVDLRGTHVPQSQVEALQQSLPNCEIRHGPLP